MAASQNKLLTVREVAEILKVPVSWVYDHTRINCIQPLPHLKIGKYLREPVCNRLGVPRFTWHSLRHTFSTYGGNSGMAMPVLQSLLGHTTPEMTMRYTHPLEQAQREAIDRLA